MASKDSACVSQHKAYITDRGGRGRSSELVKLSQVQWGRVRDDISEGSIVIRAGDCAPQAKILSNIEPKRSELVIYRGDDRVWEGPVDRCAWRSDRMEIIAKDVSSYVMGRPLTRTWDNSYVRQAGPDPESTEDDVILDQSTEVTTRIGDIIEWEMSNSFTMVTPEGAKIVPGWEQLDPPANVLPYLVIHHHPNEARTSAKTLPFQMAVGEHLDNLAHTGGIDYTVIGRAIHIWDTSNPLGRGRLLTEADFYGEIIVTAYGADFAAVGITTGADGMYGAAGQNDPYYGPWAKVFTVYDENADDNPSQNELSSQARRNLTGRNPVPVEVRVPDNSTLRLTKGLSIDMLVPGAYFPLLATLNDRKISQMQKLNKVTVTETSKGENVEVTFVPSGRSDEVIP